MPTGPDPDPDQGPYLIRPPSDRDEENAGKAENSSEGSPTDATGGQPGGEQPQGLDVVCAFTVALGHDGHWLLLPDASIPLMVRRQPMQWDFLAACGSILAETQIALITQSVVNAQMQMASQIQQRMASQQIADQLFGPDGKMRRG